LPATNVAHSRQSFAKEPLCQRSFSAGQFLL
jgi:hypothetical protein